ncbi:MAG: tRNA (N6-threonylcarbamoyladenosine(37)-N6)-methyltransferase TrmO [Bacteroidales bacterium]|nr:tRNA (N6-threonylcarbamoyladenosine(37)-N6)-methyltransferase TrmO [Bacteroidales bacterium]
MKINFFIAAIILFFVSCSQEKVTYQPIGYFVSEFTKNTGAPRQGILMPETKGQILLKEEYVEGLAELSDFEYIWVIFDFNQAKGWENIVRPPESKHTFGIFATRSPRRPNPIGLSLVKLDSIQNNILFVSGVDIFNGTPILDIKPYLPSVDFVYSQKNMQAEVFLGHHSNDFLTDSLVKIFIEGMENYQDTVLSGHHH